MGYRRTITWFLLWLIPLYMTAQETGPAASDKKDASKNSSHHLVVSFPSGGRQLPGYLFKPVGAGPFPAVIYHHYHHKGLFLVGDVPEFEPLAKLFTSRGFILFVPDRHIQSFEPEEFPEELQKLLKEKKDDPEIKNRLILERFNLIGRDVSAAVHWLKERPEVDKKQIVVAGAFGGAVQALLFAESDTEVRAFILFSPAAGTWTTTPIMQPLLRRAARDTRAPIFILNVQNEISLLPAEILGKEIERKNNLNQSKMYPPFGKENERGLRFSMQGCDIWGPDVLRFIEKALKE